MSDQPAAGWAGGGGDPAPFARPDPAAPPPPPAQPAPPRPPPPPPDHWGADRAPSGTVGTLVAQGSYPGITQMLVWGAGQYVNDLHLLAGGDPWYRRGGLFTKVAVDRLEGGYPSLSEGESFYAATVAEAGTSSCTIAVGDCRWRATAHSASDGRHLAWRRIPETPMRIAQLGLPDAAKSLSAIDNGLVMAVGATGSGKTSTLAAFIQSLNETSAQHIITIEDPLEYRYVPSRSRIVQREVRADEYDTALALAMRTDPDVILLGEVITPDHFQMCMTLAASGHLVFTTMHARNVSSAVQRIAAVTGNDGRSLLSQTLRGIIAQRLVPKRDNRSSRVLAAEVLVVDDMPGVRNYISPGGDMGRINGMLDDNQVTLEHSLARLAIEGMISVDDARRSSADGSRFDGLIADQPIAH